MYFKNATPESVGISSKAVYDFIKTLDDMGFCTHSMIMARGDKIFAECYWAPFNKDFKHRMYSVSKSFVAVAVGMAIDDGLLSLDDKMVKYFPEHQTDDELIRELTIKDMLCMCTAVNHSTHYWFTSGTKDRTEMYFKNISHKIPGSAFAYDSPGTFMLTAIVERVTGKPFLEYMKEKALNDIGFSKDSYCLTVPGGHSFGDSGVMCTARDLILFARFVMNKGEWDGKQYMSRDFLEEATKKQVCNNTSATILNQNYTCGYGYQIWKAPNDGFAFVGMGDQFAICDPKTDFIFIINSDNQGGSGSTRPILYYALYKEIINKFEDALPEDNEAYQKLCEYTRNLKLFSLKEERENPFINEINDKVYPLKENPMEIEYIKLHFEDKRGTLYYKNLQGEKELHFGIGYNEFQKFPQEGYSDLVTTEYKAGNYYDCAVSADWTGDKQLRIKVQIIDKYFGNACFIFSFKDKRVSINMVKYAENFLNEYTGTAIGELK